MANEILSGFNFYQSANAEAGLVKSNFLVRIHEFDIIMDDIRRQPMKGSVQHFLIIGRRGSGKSTLLKRIQIEIESSAELAAKFIAVNLAEEQANIYKLYDLLEAVLEELEYHGVEVSAVAWNDDATTYARKLFAAIHKALQASGKKLVLLLDNIDRVFENMQDDASLLREYLLNYDDLKIIGGSTKMTEHFWKYNKPFYEFFRVLELKPLSSKEIKRLMVSWSEKLNLPELAEFVKNKPGQLETVRILTDGLPRTLQFFVNILLTRTHETGYEYLRLIMDTVTPLYQERLNSLPPSQRKIVLQMAFLWESVGAGELGEAAKMDAKVISAQLKQLTEKAIAEKIPTGTKNHLYRLSERFFNLWLIFTQGSPKEKRKARCLTVFLENFYDAEEIMKMTNEHLKALKEGKPLANKAALLTKALAQSKYINFYIRDELITSTIELKNLAEELRHQLPPTTKEINVEIESAINRDNFNKALKIAQAIEHEDGYRELLLGYVNARKEDFEEAAKWFQKSYDNGFEASAVLLAKTYKAIGKQEQAKKYFLKGIDMQRFDVYYSLGEVCTELGQHDEAVKYYEQALNREEWKAAYKLGNHYFSTNIPKAENYLTIAVEHEVIGSALSLAVSYYCTNKEKSKAQHLLQLEKGWSENPTTTLCFFEVLLNMWNGNMENIDSSIMTLFSKRDWGAADFIIKALLVHGQINLAVKLFSNPDFGNDLKDDLLPLFYATSMLSKQDKSELRIPPELKETVEALVADISDWSLLYK
jgi:tetratricopeptide (TPR) repeat protein